MDIEVVIKINTSESWWEEVGTDTVYGYQDLALSMSAT